MSPFSGIALIGFGEVGQILAEDLGKAGVARITSYDVQFVDAASSPSKAAAGMKNVCAKLTASDAIADSDLIISAVTAASDVDAARSAAPGLRSGAFYLDLNSASPQMKRQAATIIDGAGGRYVEAAVMTPFPPKRIASAMLLGGSHAGEFQNRSAPLGFCGTVYAEEIGKASATKMCRSVMIKGIEALLMESMLAARAYGVEDDVISSLSDLLPVGDWMALAKYMISRSLEHGVRRAEEMQEVAQTVAEVHVEPLMSMAVARRQKWAAERKAALRAETLGGMLDIILQMADEERVNDH